MITFVWRIICRHNIKSTKKENLPIDSIRVQALFGDDAPIFKAVSEALKFIEEQSEVVTRKPP